MADTAEFWGVFGGRAARTNDGDRLVIRDGALIPDIKAMVSDLAARDNRARGSGWTIDFSPVRRDLLTERSMFDVTLASAALGLRRFEVRVARDWVEVGDGAMESSIRDTRNLPRALEKAFRRVVLDPTRGAGHTVPVEVVSP